MNKLSPAKVCEGFFDLKFALPGIAAGKYSVNNLFYIHNNLLSWEMYSTAVSDFSSVTQTLNFVELFNSSVFPPAPSFQVRLTLLNLSCEKIS